jgi:hypothetical protein
MILFRNATFDIAALNIVISPAHKMPFSLQADEAYGSEDSP